MTTYMKRERNPKQTLNETLNKPQIYLKWHPKETLYKWKPKHTLNDTLKNPKWNPKEISNESPKKPRMRP